MKLSNLKYFSVFSLVFILSLTTLAISQLHKLKFDYSFESFFPLNDPDLAYYEQFNEAFGQQNDFLFVALQKVDLSDTLQLQEISDLTLKINERPGVKMVNSFFEETIYQITPFGINLIKKYIPNKPIRLSEEQTQMDIGKYFGKDLNSTLLLIRHQNFSDKKDSDDFYNDLESWIQDNSSFPTIISGKAQMQRDFTDFLESELQVLLSLGFGICLLVLLVLLKSPKRVLFAVLVMALTLIWILGFMGATSKPIDVMIVMLPAILLIISLSDTIHLINKHDYLLEQNPPEIAILKATKSIGKANLITSITTAIGFLGLLFIPIKPIKEFGLLASAGIMFAFAITMCLVPALFFFFPSTKRTKKGILDDKLDLLSKRLSSFGKIGKWSTLIGAIVILSGIPFIKLNTGLIVGLQKDEPMLEMVDYFDSNFNGYRPLEIGIDITGFSAADAIISKKVAVIEQAVKDKFRATGIQSTNSILRKINSALYGGSPNYLKLPEDKDIARVKRVYGSNRLATIRNNVESESGNLLRIVASTPDLGSAFYLEQETKLQLILDSLNDNSFEAKLTGSSHLIDKTDNYVINALSKGLIFACLTVAIIILIFYRSWRLASIIMLINIIPIALLFGLMGLLGIELNISTAIIFTVAFGIAVDDSIHLISRFELERKSGASKTQALELAKLRTGKSILFTTIAIIFGFSTLLLSGFSAVYYLGLFICASALLAIWFDLKVLPYVIERWNKL